MGSWEETPNQTQTESGSPSSGFNSNTHLPDLCPGPEKGEETIVDGLKNLALEENGWDSYGQDSNNETLQVDWQQSGENSQYPLRPYAGDCSFYLKTGNCKFGLNCKFNHPVGKGFQDKENHKGWTAEPTGQIECKYYRAIGGCKYGKACRYRHSNEDHVLAPLEVNSPGLPVQVGLNEKKDGIVEQMGQIECKYYLTSGGCKYGNACRYSHSKVNSWYLEKSEIAPPELNFLGLPIRVLEKECPYYMRNGTCAYGPNCRFNHPDPTAAEGSKTFSPDPFGFLGGSSVNHNGETNPLRLLRASEPIAASLSSNMKLDKHVPYLDRNSSYAHPLHLNSGWNECQEKASHPYSVPSIQNAPKTADISNLYQEPIRVDEFPERPGEPECPYFMKTGYCKYKAACKFHHPKTRLSNPPALNLSSAGLPLRPGRKICRNYEKFGICKYGNSCFFDHPENHLSSTLLVDPLP